MSKDRRKNNKPPDNPGRPKRGQALRFQARLHTAENEYEAEAIESYHWFKDSGWTNRQIARDALRALRMAYDDGYELTAEVHTPTLNRALLRSIDQMLGLVHRLSNLDLSGAVNRDGTPVDIAGISRDLNSLQESSVDLMGDATFFDIEDDE